MNYKNPRAYNYLQSGGATECPEGMYCDVKSEKQTVKYLIQEHEFSDAKQFWSIPTRLPPYRYLAIYHPKLKDALVIKTKNTTKEEV